MLQIPQEIIKKSAFEFIKAYYEYRPRIGKDITATYDEEMESDFMADGYFSYQQKNGASFFATLQTISRASLDKVIGKLRKQDLIWDSVAIATTLTALLFYFGYFFRFSFLEKFAFLQIGMFLLICFLTSFVLLFFLLRYLKRYQYIFAIEKFKKHPANERWIAFGKDVFADANSGHEKNLKNQCIQNGFGLLSVNQHSEVELLVAPSQYNELIKQKKSAELLLSKLLLIGSFVIFVMIGSALYLKLNTDKNLPFEKVEQEKENSVADIDTVQKENNLPREDTQATTLEIDTIGKKEVLITDESGRETHYNCERFHNFSGAVYLVQYGEYPNFQAAQKQIKFLKSKNINVNCIWLGCFSPTNNAYVIFYGFFSENQEEAKNIAYDFSELLKAQNINTKLKIKAINKVDAILGTG